MAISILSLLAFIVGGLWLVDRGPVSWDRIYFNIEAGGNSARIRLWHNYTNDKDYLFLPSFCAGENTGELSIEGAFFKKWDDTSLRGDQVKELSIEAGSHRLKIGQSQYELEIVKSSGVPTMFIETESGSLAYIEEEKGNGERAMYRYISPEGDSLSSGDLKEIRSRGNATYLEDKKPYQINLAQEADLIGSGMRKEEREWLKYRDKYTKELPGLESGTEAGGLPDTDLSVYEASKTKPHKKYILLANRQDQALIRNRILYDMAGEMGLPYSPMSIFIDLYINNDYRGCYQLCEKVDTGTDAIDIEVKNPNIPTDYLISLEYNDAERLEEEEYRFVTEAGQNVAIARPKKPTDEQIDYIKDRFQQLEDWAAKENKNGEVVMHTGGSVPDDEKKLSDRDENVDVDPGDDGAGNLGKGAYIAGEDQGGQWDLESFAMKYVMEEYSKNLDAMHTSQYFYEKNGILYAGPVWDYDKTLGNPLIERNRPVDFQEARGLYASTEQMGADFWKRLYDIGEFKRLVQKAYAEKAEPVIDRMLDSRIDGYVNIIRDCAAADYLRWDPFEDQKYERESSFDEGYGWQVDQIRTFMEGRREFLRDIWVEGRKYDKLVCDPGRGTLYVKYIDAVEGRSLPKPRKPEWEGHEFSHWIRKDTGEEVDFNDIYRGDRFEIEAVYK